jgi:hypothetical protein
LGSTSSFAGFAFFADLVTVFMTDIMTDIALFCNLKHPLTHS